MRSKKKKVICKVRYQKNVVSQQQTGKLKHQTETQQ